MTQSFRPQHSWRDEDDGSIKATLFCNDCELEFRKEEWVTWGAAQRRVAGHDYPTIERVRTDQKKRAKEKWSLRSEPILNAKVSIRALQKE